MYLVERSEQLALLEELRADCAQGNGKVALISAPTGFGKTALLHRFLELAEHSETIIASASCAPADQHVPFTTLAQLFENPVFSSADLPCTGSRANNARRTPSFQQNPSAALLERVLARHIRTAAERHLIIVAVDDVHNADQASLSHLLRMVRSTQSARVLTVLTDTASATQPHSELNTELLRLQHASYIPLSALSPRGIAELVTHTYQTAAPPPLVEKYHELTGGSPRLIRAMLEHVPRADHKRDEGIRADSGPAFGRAVLSSLRSASAEVTEVARGIALLGDAASYSLMTHLLDIPLDAVKSAVLDLNHMGLADGFRFRHPTTADIVLTDIGDDKTALLHQRTARLLFEFGYPNSVVAHHLLRANSAGETWMIDVFIEAAKAMLASDKPTQANAYLELARRSSEDNQHQAHINVLLTTTRLRISPATAARMIPGIRCAISAGYLSDRTSLDLPEIFHVHHTLGENIALYQQLFHTIGTDIPRNVLELRIRRMLISTIFPQFCELVPEPAVSLSDSELAITPFEQAKLSVFADLNKVMKYGPNDKAARHADRVLRTTRLVDGTVWLLATAIEILIYSDQLENSLKWIRRLTREAAQRSAVNWIWVFGSLRAKLALRYGDLGEAEQMSLRALKNLPQEVWGACSGDALATLLSARTELRRYRDAARLLNEPLPTALQDTIHGVRFLQAKGDYQLAIEEYDDALSDFNACGELVARWGLDHSTVAQWRCGAAEAAFHLGDRATANELIQEELNGLRPRHATAAKKRAWELFTRISSDGKRVVSAPEAVQLAPNRNDVPRIPVLSRSEERANLATSLLDQPAAEPSIDARVIALTSDADPTPANAGAHNRLRRLTVAERRVGLLASQGYTNKEIAGNLRITVSTVEQHLTRIYRKLGIQQRKQLAARLRE